MLYSVDFEFKTGAHMHETYEQIEFNNFLYEFTGWMDSGLNYDNIKLKDVKNITIELKGEQDIRGKSRTNNTRSNTSSSNNKNGDR